MYIENANKPHGFGIMDLNDYTPFPKNPVISSFFRQIYFAEELGSGFKKVAMYAKAYFGSNPIIEEKDIFRFTVKFGSEMMKIFNSSSPNVVQREIKLGFNEPVNEPVNLSDLQKKMIALLIKKPNITKDEIMKNVKKSRATITRNIARLKESGMIKRVGSDKTGYWEVIVNK